MLYDHIPPRSRPSRELGAGMYPNHPRDNREHSRQSVSLLFIHSVNLSE